MVKGNQLAKLRGTSWGNWREPVGETGENWLGNLKRNQLAKLREEGNQMVKLKRNQLAKRRGTSWGN